MSENFPHICKRSILEALEYSALTKSIESIRYSFEGNTKQKTAINSNYYDLIIDELENLHIIIELTNQSVDALNIKYADLENPPTRYITERLELMNKLRALNKREQELSKELNIFDLDQEDNNDRLCLNKNFQTIKYFHCNNINIKNKNIKNSQISKVTAESKILIRAHLPNKQRTSIEVMPGITLYQALSKPLKLRQLQPELCKVTTTLLGRKILSWDTDISTLYLNEIYIQILDAVPIKSHISHQIVRKTFFSLTFCEACRRLLFAGFYCKRCDFRFHRNCFHKVPPLCKLLSTNKCFSQKLRGEDTKRQTYGNETRINKQGRSISTPNVCLDKIEPRIFPNSKEIMNEQKWEISSEEIIINEFVGKGIFGTVYKAYWHGTIAVKMLNLKSLAFAQLNIFKDEMSQLQKLHHSNLLRFTGAVLLPALAIATEWCEGITLFKHIHVNEADINLYTVVDIGLQISQGMDYLHAKNILHGDLKSQNIFLKGGALIKICDFGLAIVKLRCYGNKEFLQPFGSVLWMAPEVIRMKDQFAYSHQSDVYAFGIIMYELTTSNLPYEYLRNKDKDQITYMIAAGRLEPDMSRIPVDVPQSLQRLIKDCLKFKAKKRPNFSLLLNMLENLLKVLPKANYYASEPILTPTELQSYDYL